MKKGVQLVCGVLLLAIIALSIAWLIDPPRKVETLAGTVLEAEVSQAGSRFVSYYKSVLQVRTDDGRTVMVSSPRSSRPAKGHRVKVQERIGWLGTWRFVEIL